MQLHTGRCVNTPLGAAPCFLRAQHNSRQHFDSADWAMGKASCPAAADAVPAVARSHQPDGVVPAAEFALVPGGPATAVNDRQPGRLQRSPVAERTQSRFCQA